MISKIESSPFRFPLTICLYKYVVLVSYELILVPATRYALKKKNYVSHQPIYLNYYTHVYAQPVLSVPRVMAPGPPYSVFVGNVPYDATEERLRDMFSEVGPVHAFRCAHPGALPPAFFFFLFSKKMEQAGNFFVLPII